MFLIHKQYDGDEDDNEYSLKPMNCPSHCLMFKRLCVSYKELPIRGFE